MEEFPILTLELKAAKVTLQRALDDRHGDLQKMIEQSFSKAIDHIQAKLDAQVMSALGEVFAECIDQAAKQASTGLAEELAAAMADQVRIIVTKRMNQ